MQYGQRTAWATARPISAFSRLVSSPGSSALPYQAKNAYASSCASSPISANFARSPSW
ncbi:MAG: hypothetical protein H0X45_00085 [Planctomycetes bacterium]|nr:hypothetical protein [Nannocystis sp.]MBA3547010.1 hypothetical protein [Nannocystis sp.]MBA3845017.1 hypothetical protein [Planctomycetota bacterium]